MIDLWEEFKIFIFALAIAIAVILFISLLIKLARLYSQDYINGCFENVEGITSKKTGKPTMFIGECQPGEKRNFKILIQ